LARSGQYAGRGILWPLRGQRVDHKAWRDANNALVFQVVTAPKLIMRAIKNNKIGRQITISSGDRPRRRRSR
jgi:hypothetical protein